MKKKFKLTDVNKKNKLENLADIKGGTVLIVLGPNNDCTCACMYADSGGSGNWDNAMANFDGGLTSAGFVN